MSTDRPTTAPHPGPDPGAPPAGGEPRSFDLDEPDSRALLARNHVGRLCFCWGGRPDVRPVHYVYADGHIYGRTSHGAKFAMLDDLPAGVAFEVDEASGTYRWRSVIVRGSLHILSPETSRRQEWQEAVDRFRYLSRSAFSTGDPFPDRSLVFRIDVEEMTGRAMEQGAPGKG